MDTLTDNRASGRELLGRPQESGPSAKLYSRSLLPLLLLLLSAQLLANARTALAGAGWCALHEAACVHGLSGLPGAALAL